MSEGLGRSDREVAAIIDAYDELVSAVEHHLQQLEGEVAAAEASGDPRYTRRVNRSITWCREVLDVLDEQVLDRVADLRHTARQLGFAREGKIV